jgi:4-hydroxy-tetrahydrodipicolinate reductase
LAAQEKIQGVMVDFTHPDGVYENTRSEIALYIAC